MKTTSTPWGESNLRCLMDSPLAFKKMGTGPARSSRMPATTGLPGSTWLDSRVLPIWWEFGSEAGGGRVPHLFWEIRLRVPSYLK